MRKLKLFFACLLMAVLSIGQVWADEIPLNIANFGWSTTQGEQSASQDGITISSTSGALNSAGDQIRFYSGGTHTFTSTVGNITKVEFTCTASGTSNYGPGKMSLATGSAGSYSYNGTIGTWTGNAASFSLSGGQARCTSVVITVSSTCDKKVTISKSATTSNGDFSLSKTGEHATCAAAVTVVVTPDPDEHYKATGVTASNGGSVSGPDGEGKYTVTYAKDYNNSSEINVNFTLKDQYTVTWDNNGNTSETTQVYEGEKPTFPSTPVSCDGSSTTFIGWATDKWDGKATDLEDSKLSGISIYTSASAMPDVAGAVTYYAVFAHVGAGSGAAVGEELLSEGFGGFSNNDVPSASNASTSVYDDAELTYACTNGTYTQSGQQKTSYTKIYGSDALAGGTAPEILVGRNGGSFAISGIPTGSATVVTLTYHTNNQGLTLATSSNASAGTQTYNSDTKVRTASITITSGSTFDLSFNNSTSSNTRVDDILIEVATAGSTSTTSDYMTTCVATSKCATPTFGVAEGTYNTAQSVTLSCGTAGATIKYTTNGDDPDADHGTVYNGAITVDKDMVIKAYAYKDGMDDSDPAEATYVLKPKTPVISGTANFWGTTEVSITCATEGAAIYYKLNDGDETPYVNPFTIDANTNIKAVAKKTDWTNSEEATANFTKIVPLTVAQAIDIIDNGTTEQKQNRYVTGIVSQVDEISTEHGNATYWISDDGNTAAFEIFRGKDINNADFTASTDIIVGDVVVVKGNLTYYNAQSVYEMAQGSVTIERTKRVVSLALSNDGTEYPVEFTKGDPLSHDHMVVTATYNSTQFAAEAVQEDPSCTWSGYDANTLGEQEITVSYGGQSVNYNVTVLGSCTKSAVISKGAESNGTYSLSVSGTQCLDELVGNVTSTVLTAIPATHYHVASVTSLADDGVTPVGTVTETSENVYTISGIGANTTITAVFEADALSPWATVYTSNVTLSDAGGTNASEATVDGKDALKAGTSSNAGAVQITVPQGTTELHYHAYGWTGKDVTLSITGPDGVTITPSSQALTNNSGMTGNSPFTLASGSHPEYDAYHSLTLSGVPNTGATLTFTSDEFRFVIWGVNAVYPAEITLDPTSNAFGEVKEGATKPQEFTISANAMCTGDLTAEIIGTDADKFEVSTIAANKVTVTFAPEVGEIGNFTAQLKVYCDNAEVFADLTATGISATQPEISVDKTLVEFGSVPQGNPLASQAVAVTLSNISTGATASISGTAFSINPENLAASGDITITPNTSLAPGNYSGTLTISATGATPKEVTVTMTIQDKWIVTYTSNIVLTADASTKASNATVVINEVSYEAIKVGVNGTNGSVAIIVPAHTTKLNFHAAGWKDKSVTLKANGTQDTPISADAALTGSTTTYELASAPNSYNFTIEDNAQPTTIIVSGNERFVIYGVNVDTYKRDVKVGNYGTLCVKNGGVLSGATLFEIAGKEDGKIYFDEVEGNVMVAGKPYIFLPEETGNATTTITVTYNTTNKTTAGYGNGFYGTYVDLSSATGTELDGNYVISNNRYILVDDDRVTLPAHRAYIKLNEIGSPSAPSGARRRVAISGAPAVATDIDALNADEAPRKVMIDGQLYIILGEKMFDATGRLVK